jgi:hypothetical protein
MVSSRHGVRSGYFRPDLPVLNTKEIPCHGLQQADPQSSELGSTLMNQSRPFARGWPWNETA